MSRAAPPRLFAGLDHATVEGVPASVQAAVVTEILELDAPMFTGVLADYPVVLRNVALC